MTKKNSIKTTFFLQAVFISLIFIGLLGFSSYLVYSKSLITLDQEIKIGLVSNVTAAATRIDGDLHRTFNAETDDKDPAYLSQAIPLEKIRQASKNVRYIYTNILLEDKVYFVVNPSPQNDADNDGVPDAPPALMDPYVDYAPELMNALKNGKAYVSAEPYTDEWGTFISAYAPFFDAKGEVAGTLGMDLELSEFYVRLEKIKVVFEKASIIILFLGLVIGLAIWFIRRSNQNTIESLHQLEQSTTQASRFYTDSLQASLGLLAQLTKAHREDQLNQSEFLASLAELEHYWRSFAPTNQEEIASFPTTDWFKKLQENESLNPQVTFSLTEALPNIISGQPVLLQAFFNDLLHTLTKLTSSDIKFSLSSTQEQLMHWELESQIEVSDPPLMIKLREVLDKKETGVNQQPSWPLSEEDSAWLEICRLRNILPLFDGSVGPVLQENEGKLTIKWCANKSLEQTT